jgi:hypothetical protein
VIRQAHTYLVGALSGVVVIGIAIAAFVVLVCAQVFHDLPISALTSSDQKAAVSAGKAVASPEHRAVATTGLGNAPTGQSNPIGASGAGQGTPGSQGGGNHPGGPTHLAAAPTEADEVDSGTSAGEEPAATGDGNDSGSHSPQPFSSSHSPSTTSSPTSGSGGGGSTSSSGTSGNSGSGTSSSGSTGSSGSGTATGTSGGGSTPTSPPSTPVTTAKPSEELTEGVNGTVGAVDEATGGTLSEAGVTHVTEEVVNGVAGPESVVGKTVDGVGEVVGGLVGGSGH